MKRVFTALTLLSILFAMSCDSAVNELAPVSSSEPTAGDDGAALGKKDTKSYVAFMASGSGGPMDAEIYLVEEALSTSPINLTSDPSFDVYPSWSKNGQQIVWSTNRGPRPPLEPFMEIWMMNWDGTNKVQLTNNNYYDFQPTIAPSGETVVYTSRRGGPDDGDLWELNLLTGVERDLTNTPNDFEQYASYSPTGQYILFDVRHTTEPGGDEVDASKIGLFDVHTGTSTIISPSCPAYTPPVGATPPYPNHGNYCGFVDPSWSKDGKFIAFASNMNNGPGPREYWPDLHPGVTIDEYFWVEYWDIYVMEVATGNVTRITSNSVPDRSPTWSVDGNRVYFSRGTSPAPTPPFWGPWENEDIWVADLTTGTESLFISQGPRNMFVAVRPK